MTKNKKRTLDAAKAKRNAFILLAVMLVLAAITLSALAFSQSMLIGHEESRLSGETIQARNAADSGIDAARLFLAYPRQTRDESGGTYNNANTFQAINVLTGRGQSNLCNYSLVAPDLNENGKYASFRFGLHNESARLNLNVLPIIDSMMSIGQLAQQMGGADLSSLGLSAGGAGGGAAGAASSGGTAGASGGTGAGGGAGAGGTGGGTGRTLLMALPGMTEDVADAILDFIDADDEPREYGAEREYYTQLPIPYAPVNGPLQSIEQLLLVRGVTPSLLFGLDQNRNGVLEASEKTAAQQSGSSMGNSASTASSTLTADGAAQLPDLGWAIYLTLYSKEKNAAGDGTARININGSDLATLQTDLASAVGEDLATFIIAYRVNGAGAGGGAGGGGGASGGGGGGAAGGGGAGFGGGGGGRNGGGGGPGAGGGQGGGRGGPGGGGPGGAGGGQGGGRGGPGGGGPGGAGGGQGGGRGGPGGGGPGGAGGGQGGGRGGPGGGGQGGGGQGGGGGQRGGGGAGPGGNGGPGGTGGGGRGGAGGGTGGGRGGRSNFDLSIINFQPFSMVAFLQGPIGGGRGQGGGGQGGQGGAAGGFGGGGQGGGGGGQGGGGGGFGGGGAGGGAGGGGAGGRGGNNGGPGGPAGGPGGAGGRGGNNGGPGGGGPGGAGGRGGNNGGPGGPGGGQGGPGGQGGGKNGKGGGRGGNGGGFGGGGMGGGGTGGSGTGGGGTSGGGTVPKVTPWTAAAFTSLNIDTSQGASSKVKQVLDLIDAQFTADVNGEQVTFTSPLTSSPISLGLSLPTIMDKLTAVEATVLPGRISINEAPREILSGLPGMTADILNKLIDARAQSVDNQNRKFETWPLVEGIVTLQQMQLIAPLVTGGGDVFRVQSVGYFEQSAGYARTEAVIDASGQIPIVALYRKMDHLGRGFSQASLGQRAMGLAIIR